jgi:uncharacterized protein YkwD
MAYAVLNVLNSERAKHNLPALRMNSQLIASAHSHNLAMAAHNTMSHRVAGEASLGTRISRAGYSWRAVGENIGWNGSMSTSAALSLERMMYDEGPGGGHYENIVSTTYRDVGIDVYLDQQHHQLWLTEDFGRTG